MRGVARGDLDRVTVLAGERECQRCVFGGEGRGTVRLEEPEVLVRPVVDVGVLLNAERYGRGVVYQGTRSVDDRYAVADAVNSGQQIKRPWGTGLLALSRRGRAGSRGCPS